MRIPLIEDLTIGPMPFGSVILVEFDPASQWYSASLAMAAGWLRRGGGAEYHDYSQPPDNIRSRLRGLGLDPEELEKNERLEIWDWYTCQLGRKSKEKFAVESLKVADLSIQFSRDFMRRSPRPELLRISDNASSVARFNDEKSWVEYVLTRVIPTGSLMKSTLIRGVMKGVHSEWAYKQLEAAHDGIVDFKLEETGDETRDMMRIRSMRSVGFDRRWHPLKIGENFEVAIEK